MIKKAPVQRRSQSQILACLQEAEDILRDILEGDKPFVDTRNVQTAWIYNQIIRLRERFLVPDEPKSYVMLPSDMPDDIKFKGDTTNHGVGYPQTKAAQALYAHLKSENIYNHTSLGLRRDHCDLDFDPLTLQSGGGGVTLGKAGLYGFYHAVRMIRHRVENGISPVPLVINDHQNLWNPLLGYLERLGVPLAEHNIHVAHSYKDVGILYKSHGKNLREMREWGSEIKPRPTILVQTGTDKKLYECDACFKYHGINVLVLPFNILVDKPPEAKETRRTYSANNFEKAEAADAKTDSLPRAEIEERLRVYGADPDNTLVLRDDRGLETMLDLFNAPEFERCAKYLNYYRAGPGVELGNIFKSMGIVDFYANLKTISERLGDDADLTAHDITYYTLSDLFPRADGKRRVWQSFGITQDNISFDPLPADSPHYYSENFLKPHGDALGRTKAQIPDYLETKSSVARAAIALSAITGMDRHAKATLRQEANPQFAASPAHKWHNYQVFTHTSFSRNLRTYLGDKQVFKRLKNYFTFVADCDNKYDYNVANAFTVQEPGENPRIMHSNLNAVQSYFEDGDAFLFGPYPKKFQRYEETKVHQLFKFMSLVVGKQVFDPSVYSKFWGIFSKDWDGCKEVYDDFHRMGFIGQKPHHIYTDIKDRLKQGIVKSAVDALNNAFKTYRRLKTPTPEYKEKGQEPKDLFRVTIYCSATSTDAGLRAKAHTLAYQLAANGFAVKNGGGTEGLMRETSDGVHAYRQDVARENVQKPVRNAIISDQYEFTMRAEGLYEQNDCVRVHPTIFQRIEKLQDTDAEIVLPGGAGTIQEIVASMITRMNGTRPVRNRPLIIVNEKIHHLGHTRGVFDKLIAYMPQTLLNRCNVVVVDDIHQALSLVKKARHNMGMKPLYLDAANDDIRPQFMPKPAIA